MTADPYAASEVLGSHSAFPAAREWARGLATLSAGLLGLTAAVIGWRRLAGALERPLGAIELLVLAGLAALAAIAARRAGPWPSRSSLRKGGLGLGAAAMVSVAVLVLAAGLSLRGTSLSGLAALWGILGAEELWIWRRFARARDRRSPSRDDRPPPAPPSPPVEETAQRVPAGPALGEARLGPSDPMADETVWQHFVRSRTPDGGERLSGWLRVPWVVGQRTTSAHVAFCPPFARAPELSVVQEGGPEAKLKVVQLLPFGVRIDLKLSSVAETDESALLHLTGQVPAAASVEDRRTAAARHTISIASP